MMVGVGRLILDYYQNDSMKLKHKNLESIVVELKRKFNISVLEIEDFEDPEKCVFGFSVVIPSTWERKSAENFLERICKSVDEISEARLTYEDCKIIAVE